MSVDASFDAYLELCPGANSLTVLDTLLRFGWRFDREGKLTYLRLGDTDDFDWYERSPDEYEQVRAVLEAKVIAGEFLGAMLTWQDTGIGGHFLIYPNGELSVAVCVDRQTIDRYTDVNWYLERLLVSLNSSEGLMLERWEWNETA